jgi:hypothetical protein
VKKIIRSKSPEAFLIRQNPFWEHFYPFLVEVLRPRIQGVLAESELEPQALSEIYEPVRYKGKPLFVGAPDRLISKPFEYENDFFQLLFLSDSPKVIVVHGGIGHGKTMFIHYFFKVFLDQKTQEGKAIPFKYIIEDANELAIIDRGDGKEARRAVYAEFDNKLTRKLLRECGLDNFAKYLVENASYFADYSLTHSIDKVCFESINEMIENYKKEYPHEYFLSKLRFISDSVSPGKLILVLDNVDPLPERTQCALFEYLLRLVNATGITAIITIRNLQSAALNISLTLTKRAFDFFPFSLTPPLVEQVIARRVKYHIDTGKHKDLFKDFKLLPKLTVEDFSSAMQRFVMSFFIQKTNNAIMNLTNLSIPDSLMHAGILLSSGYVDINRLIPHIAPPKKEEEISPYEEKIWPNIPYSVYLKSIILRNYPYYFPEKSLVINLFDNNEPGNPLNHFLRYWLLLYLLQKGSWVRLDSVGRKFVEFGYEKEVLKDIILFFLSRHLIESDQDVTDDKSLPTEAQLKITTAGAFYIDELAITLEYLQHLMDDCYLEDDIVAKWENLESRDTLTKRLEATIDYLKYLNTKEIEAWQYVFHNPGVSNNSKSRFLTFFKNTQLSSRATSVIAEELDGLKKSSQVTDDRLDPFIKQFKKLASDWSTEFNRLQSIWVSQLSK